MFILMLLVIPLVASASWWNPVSWFGGWFGMFDKYAVEETVTDSEATNAGEETSGGGFFSGKGFFSRARPANDNEASPTTAPAKPTSSSTTSQPTTNAPSGNEGTPSSPTSSVKPATTPPKHDGVVSFDADVRVARRTTGTATSSNTMRIWFPATSTKMTIKETAVSGITFKTGTCKAFPCTLTNVVSVTNRVAEGTYPVSVTITSGTSTAVGTFSVVVLPPEPLEILVTVSGPINVKKSVSGSVSGSNTVHVQLLRGTAEKLTLTNSDFPDGITGKTTLSSCTPPCKVTNSVSVSYAAETGRRPMVIRAVGPTVSRSVGYDINVAYSSAFGMHFGGEVRSYTQNQNPTAIISIDYPFDLLLDGGTPEIAELAFYEKGSTTIRYSQGTCRLPCFGLNAHIEFLRGMKPGTYTIPLKAVVKREEEVRGEIQIKTYTETRNLTMKIIPIALPF